VAVKVRVQDVQHAQVHVIQPVAADVKVDVMLPATAVVPLPVVQTVHHPAMEVVHQQQ
jgi:hypothetical protein